MTHSAASKFAVLKIPVFQQFLASRFSFIIGLRMVFGILCWWINDLTHDPFKVSLIGLSEVIPAIGFALYAGVVVDRSNKQKLLFICQWLYLLCVALFLVVAYFAKDQRSLSTTLWLLYFITFLTGCVRAFSGPTFNAMMPNLVPKEQTQQAVTLSSFSWQLASATGPIIAGFIIAGFSLQIAFWAVLLCNLVAIAFTAQLPSQPPAAGNQQKTWTSVKEGLAFVFANKPLLGALTLDMFAVFFGGITAMIPYYASDVLHVGASGYGWLNAAEYIGAITTLLAINFWPLRGQQGKIMFVVVAGFGIMTIVFAFSKVYWISLLALLFAGFFDGISVVIRGTILLLLVPDHMRGRVSSVNSMFINSSNELGMMESGLAQKLMGTVSSVAFGGLMTLVVVVITWFKAPKLKEMEY
jgi:MFS family permease